MAVESYDNQTVLMTNAQLGASQRFPNRPDVIQFWQRQGWVLGGSELPDQAGAVVLTLAVADSRYAPLGAGSTSLPQLIRDTVAAMVTAGTNVTTAYNSSAGTLTISAAGTTTTTPTTPTTTGFGDSFGTAFGGSA